MQDMLGHFPFTGWRRLLHLYFAGIKLQCRSAESPTEFDIISLHLYCHLSFPRSNFNGSLFQSVNVIIIPCAAYAKLCNSELQGRPLKKALLYLMLSAGSVWCVVDIAFGVMNIGKQRAL